MKPPSADFPVALLDAAVELMGRAGRSGTVRVRGQSMQPTLQAGQVLKVEFSFDRLRRGDLLLYRQEDYLVVHRLLGRARFPDGRRSLRTRGDATLALDPHLDVARVIGRVTAIRDDDGWWDLRSAGARAYAWGLAWHDLFWACVGVLGLLADRVGARVGLRGRFRSWVGHVDRRLLGLAHRLCFRRFHRRSGRPEPLV